MDGLICWSHAFAGTHTHTHTHGLVHMSSIRPDLGRSTTGQGVLSYRDSTATGEISSTHFWSDVILKRDPGVGRCLMRGAGRTCASARARAFLLLLLTDWLNRRYSGGPWGKLKSGYSFYFLDNLGDIQIRFTEGYCRLWWFEDGLLTIGGFCFRQFAPDVNILFDPQRFSGRNVFTCGRYWFSRLAFLINWHLYG